jgi:hypothetical protein
MNLTNIPCSAVMSGQKQLVFAEDRDKHKAKMIVRVLSRPMS